MCRVIPTITTLSSLNASTSWLTKIAEVESLGLSQVALFVTGLNCSQRKHCYAGLEALKERHDFSIPFVHAVTDMTDQEYLYLMNTFGTEQFNLHPEREYPALHSISDTVKARIYIENSEIGGLVKDDVLGYAGICLDLSHLDDTKRHSQEAYERTLALADSFKIGANHVSAVGLEQTSSEMNHGSKHEASNSDEFSYLSNLPSFAFSDLMAIELENSLEQQCRFLPVIQAMIDLARAADGVLAA